MPNIGYCLLSLIGDFFSSLGLSLAVTSYLNLLLRICLQCRSGFNSWVGKIPWRRKWQPTQCSWLENPMDCNLPSSSVQGAAGVRPDLVTKPPPPPVLFHWPVLLFVCLCYNFLLCFVFYWHIVDLQCCVNLLYLMF